MAKSMKFPTVSICEKIGISSTQLLALSTYIDIATYNTLVHEESIYWMCSFRIEQEYGIPNVMGIIDGTHIEICKQAIPTAVEYQYVNRKQGHSLNVQVVSYLFCYFNSYTSLCKSFHLYLSDSDCWRSLYQTSSKCQTSRPKSWFRNLECEFGSCSHCW